MICPKCKAPMVIDHWYGWRWTCFNCDYVGRKATNEETEQQEKEYENRKKAGKTVQSGKNDFRTLSD